MSSIQDLIELITQFRDERDWEQFHNPKDLALALSIEAAELSELFLWKTPDQADPQRIREELADVFIYAILMLMEYNLELGEIVEDKIALNALKYPVERDKSDK